MRSGARQGAERPGFLSFSLPWFPLCVPSAFELHVAEGVKITKVQSLDLNPRSKPSVGSFQDFVVYLVGWLVGWVDGWWGIETGSHVSLAGHELSV